MLCPKTKKWVKKGKTAGDKWPLFFDVDGLEEGEEYNFRVFAVNELGESEPLEGDKPIKAKNPFGEYNILMLSSNLIHLKLHKISIKLHIDNIILSLKAFCCT